MADYRLTFSKEGRAVWISHLDLLRTFQRAFIRAGLVVRHSQGFHPHPVMSFVLPLSVGQSSACELLDFLRRPEPLDRMFSEAPHPADGEPVVVIGRENPYRELQNATLVFGRYAIAGHESGTLGLLGPTRMDYARIIPSLQELTEIVGKVLSDSVEE